MFRSVLAITGVLFATLFFGVAAILGGLFYPRIGPWLMRGWSRAVNRACGVTLRVEGAERLDPSRSYVFAANHRSLIDIPAIVRALPFPLRFVAKKELRRIPFFGRAMEGAGTITIDRGDPEAARRTLRAKTTGGLTASLLFFPEGTRSTSEALLPFRKGCAATAALLGYQLVPVAVVGTASILPKHSFRVTPGQVKVLIGAPIAPPADSSEARGTAVAALQAEIERLLLEALEPRREAGPLDAAPR